MDDEFKIAVVVLTIFAIASIALASWISSRKDHLFQQRRVGVLDPENQPTKPDPGLHPPV
jgi:lipopolysaccharide/colanic/teichoic acid biosynthesis glycosyltransferase